MLVFKMRNVDKTSTF
ncbi:23S rRNA methyltransferase attenuation leader peptide [Streptococcus suis]|nr:23S rRNA methyltransferase attenuation leader peptide [Streptococcus suis]